MMIKIKDTSNGDIYSNDMSDSNKLTILEIHFCTSYTQAIVQKEVTDEDDKFEYKTKDLILPPIGSIQNSMNHFNDTYSDFKDGCMNVYLKDDEAKINVDIKDFSLNQLKGIFSEINNIVKGYNKLNNRNKKKDDLHLNKHAMHLIRLYLMCLDMLEGKGIVTYRENDREFLLDIRNGEYQKEDSTFRSEFFDMVNDYEKKMKYALTNTEIPKKPDFAKIEELVMEINRKVVSQ